MGFPYILLAFEANHFGAPLAGRSDVGSDTDLSRGKQVDRPGKLGTLVRRAQSERPKERQSGVVKVDGRLRGRGALARWARTGGL